MTNLKPFSLDAVKSTFGVRTDFLVVEVALSTIEGGYRVEVAPDARFADSRAGYVELQGMTQGWRFAAGGALVLLACSDVTVALVRYRDSEAPNYPEHWTLGSGVSSSVADLLDVSRLALMEGIEEFMISVRGSILLPRFADGLYDDAVRAVSGFWSGRESLAPAAFRGEVLYAPASFVQTKNEQTLEVVIAGNTQTHHGMVVLDERTRGIDLLKVVRIEVGCPFSDVAIFDGERFADGTFLNNPVACVAAHESNVKESSFCLQKSFKEVFKDGMRQHVDLAFDARTPVLEAVSAAHWC